MFGNLGNPIIIYVSIRKIKRRYIQSNVTAESYLIVELPSPLEHNIGVTGAQQLSNTDTKQNNYHTDF